MSEQLIDAMVSMREQEALETAKELLDSGTDPQDILDACTKAMEAVGEHFESGKYFLPQLMMAGEILRQVTEMVKPKLKSQTPKKRRGKVVIGTVKGDIHDIGKDMVVFTLDVNGFDVLDLGIDVDPEKFVEAVRDFQPQVVGLSGFLTLAFEAMRETVEALKKANVRDAVKVMIGGGQIDDEVRRYTGADAFGLSAIDAVKLSKGWTGGN